MADPNNYAAQYNHGVPPGNIGDVIREFQNRLNDYFGRSDPPVKIAYLVYFTTTHLIRIPIFMVRAEDPRRHNALRNFFVRLSRITRIRVLEEKIGGKDIITINFLGEFFGLNLRDYIRRSLDFLEYNNLLNSMPIGSIFNHIDQCHDRDAYNYLLTWIRTYYSLPKRFRKFRDEFSKKIAEANKRLRKIRNSGRFSRLKGLYLRFLEDISNTLQTNPDLVLDRGMVVLIRILAEIFDALAKDGGKTEGDPLPNLRDAVTFIRELEREHTGVYNGFKTQLMELMKELGALTEVTIPWRYLLVELARHIRANWEDILEIDNRLKSFAEFLDRLLGRGIRDPRTLKYQVERALDLLAGDVLSYLEDIEGIISDEISDLESKGVKTGINELKRRHEELIGLLSDIRTLSNQRGIINRINNPDTLIVLLSYILSAIASIERFFEELLEFGE